MFALRDYQELRRRTLRAATRVLLRGHRARSQSIGRISRNEIRRVLICRPNHRLGNLLLLTPLLQDMQRVFPDAIVDIVLAGDDGAGLFRTFDNVGRIHTLSRRMVRHPLQTARIAMQIRHAKYDLAIDPCEGSQSSRWLTVFAHAAQVIGVPGDAPMADNHPAADAQVAPRHMAKWPVYQLRRAVAGCGVLLDVDYPALDIRLSPDEHRRGRQILSVLTSAGSQLPRVIGVFADATGAKRYGEAWWVRFIEALRARVSGFTFVEIAPPDGRSRLSSRCPSFFSPDLREVAAVISQMACFVSADCGVMHLASASGTPTIGLFSVTDMALYTPYGHDSCGLDTNGKSSERVAQQAATAMGKIQTDGIASTTDRATSPTPSAGPPNLAGGEPPAHIAIEDRRAFF